MDKYIELICTCCEIKFLRLLRQYKYEIKRRGDKTYSPLCGSKECKIKFKNTKKNLTCDFCLNKFDRALSQISKYNFCSQSCSAKFSNAKRVENGYTTKGLYKNTNCTICRKLVEVGYNSTESRFICKQCRLTIKLQKHSLCILCGAQINNAGVKKYCDFCRKKKASLDSIIRVNQDSNSARLKSIVCKYKFNDSMIRCDSKAEYSSLNYIETHYDVLDISRSKLILEYELDGYIRRYNPDFDVKLSGGKILIVECKTPLSSKDLQRKWKIYYKSIEPKKLALEKYCNDNNCECLFFNKDMHNKYYNSLTREFLAKTLITEF